MPYSMDHPKKYALEHAIEMLKAFLGSGSPQITNIDDYPDLLESLYKKIHELVADAK